MEITKESLAGNKVKLTISLEMSEWSPYLDRATEELSANIKIEGFRPGKAPREVVITKVGESTLVSSALEMAVEEIYPKVAREQEIKPIAFPAMSVEQAGIDKPLKFVAEVAVMPEVVLGDYSKIRVKKEVAEVTEAMVEETLEGLRKKAAEYTDVDREAREGDWTEIDFTGMVEGKEFPGGASKNHPLVLGEKMFIPGFEEGVVGMKAGEEKEIEVTFPAEYHATDLAGKPATFKVKLHKVKEMRIPDIDDAFAKSVSQFSTIAELRADIRKFMEEDAERKAIEKVREEAIEELVKVSQMEVASELVDQELMAMINDLKHQVAHGQMSFDDYLKKANTDEEALKTQWKEQAEKRVRAGLALDAFRKAENISVSHDEVHAEIDRLKEQYPEQAEDIEKHYGGHNHGQLENQMMSRKAVDRLVEIVVQ